MGDHEKELARRLLHGVYESGELALADELVASTFVDHEPAHPGQPVGPLSVKQTAGRLLEAFGALRFDVEAEIAEGDMVVQLVTMSGEHTGVLAGHPPTGRTFRRAPCLHLADRRWQDQRALGKPGRSRPPASARPAGRRACGAGLRGSRRTWDFSTG